MDDLLSRIDLLAELDSILPQLPPSGRVGILGGTFDPPHVGHALLAHSMLATENIDELWVIPVFEHPFGKSSANFHDRMELCRIAFRRLGDAVQVVPIERELPRPSYTVQTLTALHLVRPGIEPTLIIGSDIVPDLPRWRHPERLSQLSNIIVVPRQGAPKIEPPAGIELKVYRGFHLPRVSSTKIKRALVQNDTIDGWLDLDVIASIRAHGLYQR